MNDALAASLRGGIQNKSVIIEIIIYGSIHKNDLLKFRNFGRKSLTELDALLDGLKLQFGMEISKFKLDKENNETQ